MRETRPVLMRTILEKFPQTCIFLENMPLMYDNRLPLEKIYNGLLASDIKVEKFKWMQDLMYATIYFTT